MCHNLSYDCRRLWDSKRDETILLDSKSKTNIILAVSRRFLIVSRWIRAHRSLRKGKSRLWSQPSRGGAYFINTFNPSYVYSVHTVAARHNWHILILYIPMRHTHSHTWNGIQWYRLASIDINGSLPVFQWFLVTATFYSIMVFQLTDHRIES
jgi:hypothetical protein